MYLSDLGYFGNTAKLTLRCCRQDDGDPWRRIAVILTAVAPSEFCATAYFVLRHFQQVDRAHAYFLSRLDLKTAIWNIYITNVPASMLTLPQVLVMYAVRWQIELIFKVWKSQWAVDRVVGRRRERILTEIYAKLIGIVVTHFLIAPFRMVDRELSPVKVQRMVRRYALRLAQSLNSLEQLVTVLNKLITRCLKSALKDKRRKRLSTLQQLQAGSVS